MGRRPGCESLRDTDIFAPKIRKIKFQSKLTSLRLQNVKTLNFDWPGEKVFVTLVDRWLQATRFSSRNDSNVYKFAVRSA